MSKTYIKELQEKIELLEDGFDIHSAEMALLENDLEETFLPNKLLGEQTGYLLDMLNELIDFEKKKPSDKLTISKNRLISLLTINSELGKIVSYNQNLKLLNQQMVGYMQVLRLKNAELQAEIKKVSESNNF